MNVSGTERDDDFGIEWFRQAVSEAVAAERKACAEIARAVLEDLKALDLEWYKGARWAAAHIEDVIRARGGARRESR